METYGTDWANIDLNSPHERGLDMLDPYSFDDLLLELNCNFKEEDLTRFNIVKHFEEVLKERVRVAREVFFDNLNSIQEKAIEEKL